MNLYWKIRRFYWKKKPDIRKDKSFFKLCLSDAKYEFRLFFFEAIGKIQNQWIRCYRKISESLSATYWNLHKTIGKPWSFGPLKRITVYAGWRVIGFLREFGVRTFWKMRRQLDAASAQSIKMYWKVKSSVVFYPFKKAYWFLYYQMQKRVLPVNKRKINKN